LTAFEDLPLGVTVFERGWLSSNNVLFVGKSEAALVDTGYATHSSQTVGLVESALAGRSLDRILNTHLHSDHCGGNAALQHRYPQIRTGIPPGESEAASNWDKDTLSYRATGQHCPRFYFDELLMPGTVCMLADTMWEVHGAPGHDPHSVILFEPSTRTLISADALWENGFGVAFPELTGEPSFEDVAKTLDHIESLAPLCVIPGHGSMFCDIPLSVASARRRLDGLQKNPTKHARHAVKVLIKFKLLEWQRVTYEAWRCWRESTPYLSVIRDRFFPATTVEELCDELLAELVRSQAAALDRQFIRNV
jgi:glyoxylase-like metal-dependent hydrolase (beta-lactamase superfamily II)